MFCNLKKTLTPKNLKRLMTLGMVNLWMTSAYASTVAQYPWAQTLKKIFDSLSGPVAYSVAGIAIVISGFAMSFLDLQGGAKKAVQAALGISIAFGATTILSGMFSFSGAMVI